MTLIGEGAGDTAALLALAELARALPDRRLRLAGDGDGGPGEAVMEAAGVLREPPCGARERTEVYTATHLALHVPADDLALSARPFEALACGVPVVALGWDGGGALRPGEDFAAAGSGPELAATVERLLADEPARRVLAEHGRATVLDRHTSTERVREFMALVTTARPSASQ